MAANARMLSAKPDGEEVPRADAVPRESRREQSEPEVAREHDGAHHEEMPGRDAAIEAVDFR